MLRLSVILACICLLLSPLFLATPTEASRQREVPSVFEVPDADERIAKAVANAEVMLERFFPKPAEIGEGWSPMWGSQARIPGMHRTRDQYIRSVRPQRIWAQYFGLSAEEVKGLIEPRLAEIAKEMAGGIPTSEIPPDLPPEFIKRIASPEGLMLVEMLQLRMAYGGLYITEVHMAADVEQIGMSVARDMLREQITYQQASARNAPAEELEALSRRLDQDRKTAQMKQMMLIMDAIVPEAKGLDQAKMLDLLAREASLFKGASTMAYVHIDPTEVEKADNTPGYMPQYGVIAVSLAVLERDAPQARLLDLTEETVGPAQARLRARFDAVLELAIEMQSLQFEMAKPRQQQDIAYQRQRRDNLRRLAQDATNDALRQRRADEADRADATLQALEQRMAMAEKMLADLRKPGSYKVEIKLLKHGDNAWVGSVIAPPMAGIRGSKFHARLRNGNAVVNITATGTRDPQWMVQQLGYFIAAMDERTEVFIDD